MPIRLPSTMFRELEAKRAGGARRKRKQPPRVMREPVPKEALLWPPTTRIDGPVVEFILPLPPSVNEMIKLASLRVRMGARTVPFAYSRAQDRYVEQCKGAIMRAGVGLPSSPWSRWEIVAVTFHVRNLRDWTEILGGLKWPVDALIRLGYVTNDSPRELAPPPPPQQIIDRISPRLELVVRRTDT